MLVPTSTTTEPYPEEEQNQLYLQPFFNDSNAGQGSSKACTFFQRQPDVLVQRKGPRGENYSFHEST